MNGHRLHSVEKVPARVSTPEEIAAWLAERRAVLTACIATDQRQLDLAADLLRQGEGA